jgi:hypothetical protein
LARKEKFLAEIAKTAKKKSRKENRGLEDEVAVGVEGDRLRNKAGPWKRKGGKIATVNSLEGVFRGEAGMVRDCSVDKCDTKGKREKRSDEINL